MKQVIRLTENDVRGLVKRCLMEVINYSESYDKDLEFDSDKVFNLDFGFIAKEVENYVEYVIDNVLDDSVDGNYSYVTRSFIVSISYSDESLLVISGTYRYTSSYDDGCSYGPPEVCYPPSAEANVDRVSIDDVEITYGEGQKEIKLSREDMRKYILPVEKEINNNIK